MRSILLLISGLLLTAACFGQDSRILFFRMDAPVGKKSSAFGESRMYTDELLRDGVRIAKMRSTSVFIYSAATVKGIYSLAPFVSSKNHTNHLEIRELKGGIAFVKISLSSSTPIIAHLELISMSDFERCYEASPWLRKRLADAGYPSVQEVCRGFHVLPLERVAGYTEPHAMRRNLTDTIFLDKNGRAAPRGIAVSFSIASTDTGGLYLIKDYYLPSGRIKSIYHTSSLDSESRQGWYQSFFESGRLHVRGQYTDGLKDGLWENYYDLPSERLWFTQVWSRGKRDGMLRSYYRDGKLKREEMHRIFTDTLAVNGKRTENPKIRETDSIVSGRKFGPSGAEITFTPFEIMPRAAYDLNEFLMKNLQYPKSARATETEGRVVVQFTLDKEGRIADAEVIKRVSEDLDKEALRVIQLMPPWQPGIQDDQAVDVIFTLPITFKLD